METKELIDALRNEDETDVSAMMDYMADAADLLEKQQNKIGDLEYEAQEREKIVVQLRKQWQDAEMFICSMCGHFDRKTDGNIVYGNQDCGEIVGYPYCKKFTPFPEKNSIVIAAFAYRRQRNREYTTQHEAAVQESREKRLIGQLREMADRTPPICQYDKPEKTMIFGKEITVYCKPFEQFQELLRRAADALDVDAVEVVRCKDCRWAREKDHREPTDTPRELICQCFKHHYIPAPWGARMAVSPDDFCSYGERKTDG